MKNRELKEVKRSSINLLLVGVALIIFGSLTLIFITQMKITPGWIYGEGEEEYFSKLYAQKVDDVTGDGVSEVLFYIDIEGYNEKDEYKIVHNTPKYGRISLFDGSNGGNIWTNEYTNPIKRVFQVIDYNEDGYNDYFVSQATVESEWKEIIELDGYKRYEPDVIPDQYVNFLISGIDGTVLVSNYTNNFINDLVIYSNPTTSKFELLCSEYNIVNRSEKRYNESIVSYDINGTMLRSNLIKQNTYADNSYPYGPSNVELVSYNGEEQLLYVEPEKILLLNLTKNDNFTSQIYNISLWANYQSRIDDFTIIEDLDLDNITEIIIVNRSGSAFVFNGSNGNSIHNETVVSFADGDYSVKINEIINDPDGLTYVIVYLHNHDQDLSKIGVYAIGETSFTELWTKTPPTREEMRPFILGKDYNDDNINEILLFEDYQSLISGSEVARYSIINAKTGDQIGQYDIRTRYSDGEAFDDFDNDGIPDLLAYNGRQLMVLSMSIPAPLWLSPAFPFGLFFFIACVIFLSLGIILTILKGRELRFNIKKSAEENKLAIIVSTVSVTVMTISFVLFLFQVDVFNLTFITGEQMSLITTYFLVVTILWYTFFPLTAAIYNQFAPQFAFFFIRLRELFFRVSKTHDHDIFILKMEGRTNLGLINKLKRLVLPTLLSIAVGFYSYSYLAPLLGYAQSFTTFGSTEFFSFLSGYMLLCTLPMILSFIIFSFLIAGNFLLDDAGVSFYRESKKFRIPGDIEPISIWAQSLIKGIAGISALLAFAGFFFTVDFSGFFSLESGIIFFIFGVFLVIVMFWGNPFITSFSYMLLAEDVMELSHNKNIEKLYKIMEKKGYDTTPRNLTKLYPSGFDSEKKFKSENNSKLKKD